jgi:hypothetical protein
MVKTQIEDQKKSRGENCIEIAGTAVTSGMKTNAARKKL